MINHYSCSDRELSDNDGNFPRSDSEEDEND